jgi:hypothetical protein
MAIAGASTFALLRGVDELRLSLGGPQQQLEAEQLAGAEGWLMTFGCVRHDLAIGVRHGRGFRLGSEALVRPSDLAPERPGSELSLRPPPPPPIAQLPAEPDRVLTPLVPRQECEEDQRPTRVFALLEEDETVGETLSHPYTVRVAPPPIAAIVSGVIGFGLGHPREAAVARAQLARESRLPGVETAPLLVKGAGPKVVWVGAVTLGVGLHGWLLLLIVAGAAVRRARRRARERALLGSEAPVAEEEFFSEEPPR